ncbi:hypothetical protein CYY_000027 [Polysphondylium violaceum]|uniref:Inner centromere protein ARK-binding domain-containing protein n=1 Tax=Polysphondylium violaceum TaxID=133409 RepID=A0A8J4QBT1_9MYCE|nr:hypothetical protein CYY_000027 [Polysphondylium violaceum]
MSTFRNRNQSIMTPHKSSISTFKTPSKSTTLNSSTLVNNIKKNFELENNNTSNSNNNNNNNSSLIQTKNITTAAAQAAASTITSITKSQTMDQHLKSIDNHFIEKGKLARDHLDQFSNNILDSMESLKDTLIQSIKEPESLFTLPIYPSTLKSNNKSLYKKLNSVPEPLYSGLILPVSTHNIKIKQRQAIIEQQESEDKHNQQKHLYELSKAQEQQKYMDLLKQQEEFKQMESLKQQEFVKIQQELEIKSNNVNKLNETLMAKELKMQDIDKQQIQQLEKERKHMQTEFEKMKQQQQKIIAEQQEQLKIQKQKLDSQQSKINQDQEKVSLLSNQVSKQQQEISLQKDEITKQKQDLSKKQIEFDKKEKELKEKELAAAAVVIAASKHSLKPAPTTNHSGTTAATKNISTTKTTTTSSTLSKPTIGQAKQPITSKLAAKSTATTSATTTLSKSKIDQEYQNILSDLDNNTKTIKELNTKKLENLKQQLCTSDEANLSSNSSNSSNNENGDVDLSSTLQNMDVISNTLKRKDLNENSTTEVFKKRLSEDNKTILSTKSGLAKKDTNVPLVAPKKTLNSTITATTSLAAKRRAEEEEKKKKEKEAEEKKNALKKQKEEEALRLKKEQEEAKRLVQEKAREMQEMERKREELRKKEEEARQKILQTSLQSLLPNTTPTRPANSSQSAQTPPDASPIALSESAKKPNTYLNGVLSYVFGIAKSPYFKPSTATGVDTSSEAEDDSDENSDEVEMDSEEYSEEEESIEYETDKTPNKNTSNNNNNKSLDSPILSPLSITPPPTKISNQNKSISFANNISESYCSPASSISNNSNSYSGLSPSEITATPPPCKNYSQPSTISPTLTLRAGSSKNSPIKFNPLGSPHNNSKRSSQSSPLSNTSSDNSFKKPSHSSRFENISFSSASSLSDFDSSEDEQEEIKPYQQKQVAQTKTQTGVQYPIETSPEKEDDDNYLYEEEDIDYDYDRNVPDWAKNPFLSTTLKQQKFCDPDKIFPDVGPVYLFEIFPVNQVHQTDFKNIKRNLSSDWSTDEITPFENSNYKSVMGFKK